LAIVIVALIVGLLGGWCIIGDWSMTVCLICTQSCLWHLLSLLRVKALSVLFVFLIYI